MAANSWTDAAAHKLALAWQANSFNLADNGSLPGANDTSGTLPTVTRFEFGVGISAGYLGGYLKRAAYWTTRLPNATLQSLTT